MSNQEFSISSQVISHLFDPALLLSCWHLSQCARIYLVSRTPWLGWNYEGTNWNSSLIGLTTFSLLLPSFVLTARSKCDAFSACCLVHCYFCRTLFEWHIVLHWFLIHSFIYQVEIGTFMLWSLSDASTMFTWSYMEEFIVKKNLE